MTKVKVIINEGIASSVLADGDVDVEIIDIDPDYEDYEALRKYEEDLYEHEDLKPIDFTTAHFDSEEESDDEA